MENTTNSVLIEAAQSYLEQVVTKKGENLKLVAKGANLTESWVYSFKEGKIKNPSVQKIEQLLMFAGFTVKVLKELQSDMDFA